MNSSIIKKTTKYINANIDKKISTKDICIYLNLSSTYVIKCFNEELGTTPHCFIQNTKINKAKKLINDGENISSISQKLGFCDHSHLTRVFKKCTLVTPSEYKSGKIVEKMG